MRDVAYLRHGRCRADQHRTGRLLATAGRQRIWPGWCRWTLAGGHGASLSYAQSHREGRVQILRDDYTGQIEQVNATLSASNCLMPAITPVIAPLALSYEGERLNVDGDRAAAAHCRCAARRRTCDDHQCTLACCVDRAGSPTRLSILFQPIN